MPPKTMKSRSRMIIYLPHPLPIWRLPQGAVERIRKAAGRHYDVELPRDERELEQVIPETEILYAWGLTGRLVGWTRNTSFSRTLSRILTKMFSFANWKTSARPGSTPR